jgi:RNA ligase
MQRGRAMHYKFPEIRTINDVLPHIEGRDEFIVAEREGYTVINYAVSMEDTFPPVNVAGGSAKMRKERSLTYRMRRECRGLIFYPDGRIMSRPWHKFFNIGEKEETQPNRINLSQPHVLMEKMDGSMIRAIVINDHLRLGTKMGVTEVAMNAETWLASVNDSAAKIEYLRNGVVNNKTHLLEWCSRKNQIVIDYAQDDLVYLGTRDNLTGEYTFDESAPFTLVARYGSVQGNIVDFIERIREEEGREGVIVRFFDGHMLKGKNDWYVRIHKTVDRIRFDRHIVELILHEQLDDVLPLLPQHEADRVRNFHQLFSQQLHSVCENYERYWNTVVANRLDRKRYAQEWMPTIQGNDNFAPQYVFGRFVGKNGREMVLDHIKKHLFTNVKWKECARWMGM